jgi:hypothetical protein
MRSCDQCKSPIDEKEFPSSWEFNEKVWCRACLERERKVRLEVSDADATECIRAVIDNQFAAIKLSFGGHMIPDSVAIETAKRQLIMSLSSMLNKNYPLDGLGEDR